MEGVLVKIQGFFSLQKGESGFNSLSSSLIKEIVQSILALQTDTLLLQMLTIASKVQIPGINYRGLT